MGWFDSWFGDKETTNTNNTQQATSQGNAWSDPRLQALLSSLSSGYSNLTGGNGFAPINGYQTAAANAAQGQVGTLNPAFTTAGGIGNAGITTADINRFMNPYTNDVVNANLADQAAVTGQQVNQAKGASTRNLAFGNTTALVGQQLARESANRTFAPVNANTRMQGFNTAGNLAGQSTQAQLGGLNTAAGLAGATGQQIGQLGTQGQTQWQDVFQNNYAPASLALGYAGAAGNLFNQAGTTQSGSSTGTSTNVASPSWASTALGGLGSVFSLFSDERVKENIKRVGKTDDGLPIYTFNMIGDPRTQMGLLAQDVEHHAPEAVGEVGGIKTVDYDRATKGAGRGHASGGIASAGFKLPAHDVGLSLIDKVRAHSHALADLRDEHRARERGGKVRGYEDGGMPSVGSSYDPSWSNTTTTPAGPDWAKIGSGLSKWGSDMGSDRRGDAGKALQSSAESLSRFMGSMPKIGYDGGGVVDDGMDYQLARRPLSYGDMPALPERRTSSAIAGTVGSTRPIPPAAYADDAPRRDIELTRSPSGTFDYTPAGVGELPWQSGDGAGTPNSSRFLGGIWAGERPSPMQNFGLALSSIKSPRFNAPFSGVSDYAKNLMQNRIQETQLDRLMQQLKIEQARLALEQEKNPATIENLQAQAALARTNADKEFLTQQKLKEIEGAKEVELAKNQAQYELANRILGGNNGQSARPDITRYVWGSSQPNNEVTTTTSPTTGATTTTTPTATITQQKPQSQLPATPRLGVIRGATPEAAWDNEAQATRGQYYKKPDGSIWLKGSMGTRPGYTGDRMVSGPSTGAP